MPAIDELAADMIAAGVRRVHVLAWRDLDDPDAGGSEVHADEFMRRWAAAGLDIVHRTSAAAGLPAHGPAPRLRRRPAGQPLHACSRGPRRAELPGRMGRSDALVEIWNGVPWFSPVWYRRPRLTILHHVHGPMWDQIMPQPARRRRARSWRPGWRRRSTGAAPPSRRPRRPARSCSSSASAPTG